MEQWGCTCGCKRFWLVRESCLLVDFGQEGAIEGHPALGGENKKFICFRCINCGKEVPAEQGYKMLEEVI